MSKLNAARLSRFASTLVITGLIVLALCFCALLTPALGSPKPHEKEHALLIVPGHRVGQVLNGSCHLMSLPLTSEVQC